MNWKFTHVLIVKKEAFHQVQVYVTLVLISNQSHMDQGLIYMNGRVILQTGFEEEIRNADLFELKWGTDAAFL